MRLALSSRQVFDAVQQVLDDPSSSLPFSAESINAAKKRITLCAGIGSRATEAEGGAAKITKKPSLAPAAAALMRATLDRFGSRDDYAAFHLKTAEPPQWPLAIEATVATVKLELPDTDDRLLRAAITK